MALHNEGEQVHPCRKYEFYHFQIWTKYRVRQRGCSLTHSARTPPAVHPGITILVDKIEIEKKKKKNWPGDDFFGGEVKKLKLKKR